jgi:hypothetical protein
MITSLATYHKIEEEKSPNVRSKINEIATQIFKEMNESKVGLCRSAFVLHYGAGPVHSIL